MEVEHREIDEQNDRKRAELRKLTLALTDLQSAKRLADLLLARRHDPALEAGLMTGLVVSYARPFASSKAIGVLGQRWQRFGDRTELKAWHRQLLTLRDKLYAHTETTFVREVHVLPPGAWDEVGARTVEAQSPWALEAVSDFSALIEFQADRLASRIADLVREIYGEDHESGTMIYLRWPRDPASPSELPSEPTSDT
jgi:hypothetical protein